jgi:tripartite-type tricarboxylate transporter receptor subunit TctC
MDIADGGPMAGIDRRTNGGIAALVGTALLAAGAACAQSYPSKPIRIVVPGTGGGGDFAARLIGQGLSPVLGQPILVENRPVGTIPGELVSRAAPDGHTLLLSASTLWLAPLLQPNVPYDPQRDFTPVSLVTMSPNILVVPNSLPAKSVKELVALARKRPGELNYGSGAAGSSNHLSAELFNAMAKVDIPRINYKNPSQAVTDLISGQIQVLFYNASTVIPHIQSGKLRALAVTSAKPTALAPQLQTMAQAGLPGYEAVATFGLFGPAGLPAPVVSLLNIEVVRYLQRPEVKEKFIAAGSETVGSTPEELAALLKDDLARFGRLIRDAKLRAD